MKNQTKKMMLSGKRHKRPVLFIWGGREWMGYAFGKFKDEGRQRIICAKPDHLRVRLAVPRNRVRLIPD